MAVQGRRNGTGETLRVGGGLGSHCSAIRGFIRFLTRSPSGHSGGRKMKEEECEWPSSWTQSPGAGAGWWGSGVSWARANVEGQRGGAQHGKGPSRAAEGTERLTRALGSSPGRRGASFIPHLWGLVLHGERAGMLTVLSGCKHPELLLIPVASTLVPVTLLPLIWFQCTVSDPVGSRGPAASCDPGAICSLRFCQFRTLSAASKTQIED